MKHSAPKARTKSSFLFKVGASAIAISLAAPIAFAQLTGEEDPFVEKIVVTARKKEELAERVPISIDVTPGLEIQQNDYRDLQELIGTVPGVNVSRAGTSDLITIRGVGSGESTAFEQSVAFAADGIIFGRSKATRLALLDLERVEVLRGPQSTYFGANTIAGVISATSRGPDLDAGWDGYIRSSYEIEQQEFVVEGATNIPVSDQLAFRVAARYSDSGGFIDNTFLGIEEPAQEDVVVRGSALWRPTSALTVDAKFTYGTLDANAGLDTELVNCTPGGPVFLNCINADGTPVDDTLNFRRATDFEELRTLDYMSGVLTVNYDFNGYSLTSISGFYDFESDSLIDLDGSAVPAQQAASRQAVSQIDDSDQLTQEFRLSSPTGRKIEWVAGLFLQQEDTEFSNSLLIDLQPATPAPFSTNSIREQRARQFSVFGSLTYNFQEDLRMIFDLRYVRATKDTTISAVSATAFPASGIPSAEGFTLLTPRVLNNLERTDDDFLPSVTVQYDVTQAINIYGSFRQGFKAGGFSLTDSTVGSTDFTAGFEPEQVNAFEVGAKGELIENRLTGAVTLFRSIFKDRQVGSFVTGAGGADFIQTVTNVGRSRSQGIEFEAAARITDTFLIQGDVTLLDSEFTDFPNAPCFQGQTPQEGCVDINPGGAPAFVQNLSGEETTYAPTWAGNVTATYQTSFRDYVFTAQPNLFFSDGYFFSTELNPAASQDSFARVNLRLSVRDEDDRWELAFVGRNLNDATTSSFCQEVPNGPRGAVGCAIDTPATFAFQGRFSF